MSFKKLNFLLCHLLTLWCLFSATAVYAQQPAFPGAEGGGRFATGGRGGTVYEVTNLNDAGPGSLRDAVSQPNRTIIFRVSGIIRLASRLTIKQDNLTIAGQTAPGDGICITGYTVNVSASNIVIRYLRCRLSNVNGIDDDAMNSFTADISFPYHDIIIDHCSLGWSVDETGTFYGLKNFTLQWCLLAESLYNSGHNKGIHGYGGIWGGQNATFHHNLLAHHASRNPRFGGSRYTGRPDLETVDFRNNVIYNWGNLNSTYGGEGGNYNMVNNYYKPGPATPGSLTTSSASNKRNRILNYTSYYYGTDAAIYPDTVWGGKFYINGNHVEGYPDVSADNWTKGVQKDGYTKADSLIQAARLNAPIAASPVTTQSALDAFASVLDNAGAILPHRDALDARLINEARTGTATFEGATYGKVSGTGISHPTGIIDTQGDVGGLPSYSSTAAPVDSDHDGMPDSWETANGLNPNNAGDGAGVAANGYTHLENYLNSIVASGSANATPTINVTGTLGGFSQSIGSPSAAQNLVISGNNLAGNVTLTAPANYQLSADNANWTGSLMLSANAGTLASAAVWVRLNAAVNGTYGGMITIAGTGAAPVNVSVNGTAVNPALQSLKEKQIVGMFPAMEGGFEAQPAGAVSTAVPSATANYSSPVWTTTGSANILSDGTARTGGNYFTYTSTSLSTKNNFSPAASASGFVKGTKYIVQYFYRSGTPAAGNQAGGLLATGDSASTVNFTIANGQANYAGTSGAWVKTTYSYTLNPSYTPTTVFGGIRFYGGGTYAIARPFDVDDFVMYPADNQASPAADATAPGTATSPAAAANGSGIAVSWAAPATGVDGGGYVVLRSTSATAPAINPNGIYSLGNAIGPDHFVVYIGANTGFTDNGLVAGLTTGTTYYYHIFTTDKAFNYSAAATASGSVNAAAPVVSVSGSVSAFTQTVGTPSASQSFSVQGSNLSGTVAVTAPAGFELSADNSSWSSSLSLAPAGKAVNATAYVRLNAPAAGTYSGNITAASAGALNAVIAVSGTANSGVVNPPPAGYDVVVAQDGTGNYTSLQAAINAAPSNRTTPYRILVKKGQYVEKVYIPATKPFLQIIGEGVNETVFSWDDYAGKAGVTEIATITIYSNDCVFMNMTIENSYGRKNDGPQALAVRAQGDRIIFKNCKMVSGQDTVMANGNGKRQYFRNCYIEGSVDYIYGSAIAVFDSCVLYNRDRLDGSTGGVFTAASTPAGQTYGYVFRDCLLPNNNGQTFYTLGRPWGNSEPPHTSETKVVFLNSRMGTTVKPERWQVWSAGTNTSLITYAEYKTRYFNGALVDLSKRLSWTKEFSDAQAAPYFVNSNMFGSWDPCAVLPEICAPFAAPISLSTFRVNRTSKQATVLFNICWPINGVTFELQRSTDSVNFTAVNAITSTTDTTAAYQFTEALPPLGTSYFYKIVARKQGYATYTTDTVVKVNISIPLNGDYRTRASGGWTNNVSAVSTITSGAVTGVAITSSPSGYTTAPTVTFGAAPSGGTTATGTAIVTNGVVTGITIINPGTGYTSAPSVTFSATGGAGSVWERYNGTTGAWETLALGTAPSNANVTIKSGHTMAVNTLVAVNNITIENGGVLQTDGQTRNLRVKGDVTNAGVFGSTNASLNRLALELDGTNGEYTISGNGLYYFQTLRPLTGVQTLTANINANLTLTGNLQAWYGSTTATDLGDDKVTINIGSGYTVKAAVLHASSATNTAASFGNYTYNVDGTLDLSSSTTLSSLVPHASNTASTVTLNVGGLLKTGTQFRTVSTTPGATEGKVVLTIGSAGLVDATKAGNTFAVTPNFFVVAGNGGLKRTVGATATLFPVGTSAAGYSPVTLSNTGTADNFTVSVKKAVTVPQADTARIVKKQWTVSEEVPGGSNLAVKLAWLTADQAGGFSPTQPLVLFAKKGSVWEEKSATITGSGTLAAPYTATANGLDAVSEFAIGNGRLAPSVTITASDTLVCPGTEVTFSAAAVNGGSAPAYQWLKNGQAVAGANAATFTTTALVNGDAISVALTSNAPFTTAATDTSNSITVTMTSKVPAQPAAMSGSTTVCAGSVETFSIAPVAGAVSYNWTLPAGASFVGGQGTNTVKVAFAPAFVTGTLKVNAVNCAGSSPVRQVNITIQPKPSTPVAITGVNKVCRTSVETYSINPVAGASSYQWAMPANASIISGQGATTVTVQFNASYSGGTLKVAAVNCSGTSAERGLSVAAIARPNTPGYITGTTTPACSIPVTYSIPVVAGATSYTWTLPAGTSYVSGQGTTTVTLMVTPGFTTGLLTVTASNCSGTSGRRGVRLYAGSACISGAVAGDRSETLKAALMINATPNPSAGKFILNITSGMDETLAIRVYNAAGNLVEAKTGVAPNTALLIGSGYHAGIYLVEVLQGKQRQTLVLVKQ